MWQLCHGSLDGDIDFASQSDLSLSIFDFIGMRISPVQDASEGVKQASISWTLASIIGSMATGSFWFVSRLLRYASFMP